jgi:hypothetical protein
VVQPWGKVISGDQSLKETCRAISSSSGLYLTSLESFLALEEIEGVLKVVRRAERGQLNVKGVTF